MKRLVPVVLLVVSMLATAAPLSAHEQWFIGTIVKFEKRMLDLKTREGRTVSIEIDEQTIVMRNSTPVGQAELKPGRRVAVNACGDSDDELYANEVRLGS